MGAVMSEYDKARATEIRAAIASFAAELPGQSVQLLDAASKALAKADHWEAEGNAVWANDWLRTAGRHVARAMSEFYGDDVAQPVQARVRRSAEDRATVDAWKAETVEAMRDARASALYERAMSYPPGENVFHDDYAQVIASAGGDRLIVTPGGSLYVLQEACAERGWRSRRFFDGAGSARAYLIAVAVGLDPILTAAAASLPDNPKDALRL